MQIHLFSGLGSSLIPSLQRGTRTLESMIDKLGAADAKHHIWNDWQKVAMAIKPGAGPVMLIGHSNGVLACAAIAKALQARRIQVAYVAAIDPTAARFPPFGGNVQLVQEFWASSGFPALVRRIPLFGQGKCLFDERFRGVRELYQIRGSHVGVASDHHVQSTIFRAVKKTLS